MTHYSVTFFPDNKEVQVEPGTDLLRAAAMAGIELKSTCGGKGTCGRCLVRVREGKVKTIQGNITARQKSAGYVLACQTKVEGNIVVEIPKDARLDEHQVLLEKKANRGVLAEKELDLLAGYEFKPICRQLHLTLDPPTLTENTSDLSRLNAEIRKMIGETELTIGLPMLQKLADTLRLGDWKVTVTLVTLNGTTEIVHLEPGHLDRKVYGVAVDIGTTTVVVDLVDMATGLTVDRAGSYNKQTRYGDDVISRMIHASENNGLEELQVAVVRTINELLKKILHKHGIDPNDVYVAVTAGNTTMAHLFLGLHPKYIRLEPYIPTATILPPVRAREVGLGLNPDAWVFSFPAVASYVGGDIVSGTLATKFAKEDGLTLFIDIGTNGEMVLGNKDWLISCACSAGPAFEGGGITFGMRAMRGAIERVFIDASSFEVEVDTIGGYKPVGICGSGLIDCLAKLRQVGIIDRTGKFQRDVQTPRLRSSEGDWEFVLVWGKDSDQGKDIVITESDIKNLIRSKGAIFAGIESLLKTVQMDVHALDKILIAGGFGNYLNIHDSVQIGLLPDVSLEKFEFVGNTSLKGAKLALLSLDAFAEALELGKKMTYLELSVGNLFMDEFMSATFLPHTDLSLFPSVKG